MLKKTITYKDFNDEEVSEDHFFHLSTAELVELEMSYEGGLSVAMQRIIDAEDGGAIIREFKKIILGSYGKRSADGRRFVKTQELRDEFESSEAYSTLFMELVTDAGAAADFVNGIIPANLKEDMAKVVKTDLNVVPDTPEIEEQPQPRAVTRQEIDRMSQEDLQKLGAELADGRAVLTEQAKSTT